MPADLASAAAAVAAGWTKTQLDRGASFNPRYSTRFEKHLTQQAGSAGAPVRADGESNVSAAAAHTAALAALNGFRKYLDELRESKPLDAARKERAWR